MKQALVLISTLLFIAGCVSGNHSVPAAPSPEDNLRSLLNEELADVIIDHIDEDRAQGSYNYPDSVLCAGVWFDFRGESDSIRVVGGPMALYEGEFEQPDVHFLGYLKGDNLFVSIGSLGEEKPQSIQQLLGTALLTDPEQYKAAADAFIAGLPCICASLQSTYSIGVDGTPVLNNRQVIR